MSLAIATVADSISKLSVTGLTIKDINEIPAKVDPRISTMIPLPDFITNIELERDSYGTGATAQMTFTYTLNYRLLYVQPGKGRSNIIGNYDNMIALVAAIIDAVIANDTLTGLIDIVPVSVTNMGVVNDPADNAYLGCDLAFNVMEFVN